MNIWDYVLAVDVKSLTMEEFISFRNYLRFIGYRVSDNCGAKTVSSVSNDLMLYSDGDLAWSTKSFTASKGGNCIPLEEVKRMAALGAMV